MNAKQSIALDTTHRKLIRKKSDTLVFIYITTCITHYIATFQFMEFPSYWYVFLENDTLSLRFEWQDVTDWRFVASVYILAVFPKLKKKRKRKEKKKTEPPCLTSTVWCFNQCSILVDLHRKKNTSQRFLSWGRRLQHLTWYFSAICVLANSVLGTVIYESNVISRKAHHKTLWHCR